MYLYTSSALCYVLINATRMCLSASVLALSPQLVHWSSPDMRRAINHFEPPSPAKVPKASSPFSARREMAGALSAGIRWESSGMSVEPGIRHVQTMPLSGEDMSHYLWSGSAVPRRGLVTLSEVFLFPGQETKQGCAKLLHLRVSPKTSGWLSDFQLASTASQATCQRLSMAPSPAASEAE